MRITFISPEVVLYTHCVQTNARAPFAVKSQQNWCAVFASQAPDLCTGARFIPKVTGIKWLIRGLIVLLTRLLDVSSVLCALTMTAVGDRPRGQPSVLRLSLGSLTAC